MGGVCPPGNLHLGGVASSASVFFGPKNSITRCCYLPCNNINLITSSLLRNTALLCVYPPSLWVEGFRPGKPGMTSRDSIHRPMPDDLRTHTGTPRLRFRFRPTSKVSWTPPLSTNPRKINPLSADHGLPHCYFCVFLNVNPSPRTYSYP